MLITKDVEVKIQKTIDSLQKDFQSMGINNLDKGKIVKISKAILIIDSTVNILQAVWEAIHHMDTIDRATQIIDLVRKM